MRSPAILSSSNCTTTITANSIRRPVGRTRHLDRVRAPVDELVDDAILAHRAGHRDGLDVGRMARDEVAAVGLANLRRAGATRHDRDMVDGGCAVIVAIVASTSLVANSAAAM
jgi:hypothetical protein